jgi:hypothetical protein
VASLYGIESERDCRNEIDKLLQSPALHGTVNKDTVAALKSRLKEYYKKGDTQEGKSQMSRVERQWFWPAIRDAYVRAPNLGSPRTWLDALYNIKYSLSYRRPKEK